MDIDKAKSLLIYHDLIASIVATMEARDKYTARHSMRVAEMAEQIAKLILLSENDITVIHIAAHIHDIGKIGIDDSVLRKTEPLTNQEWLLMKKHPVIGSDILSKIERFSEISQIVRHHHERWDGKGYPDGLRGKEIPLASRIIAVADSIDAMMSDRKGMTFVQCRAEIEKNAGVMYDATLVSIVLSHWLQIVDRQFADI